GRVPGRASRRGRALPAHGCQPGRLHRRGRAQGLPRGQARGRPGEEGRRRQVRRRRLRRPRLTSQAGSARLRRPAASAREILHGPAIRQRRARPAPWPAGCAAHGAGRRLRFPRVRAHNWIGVGGALGEALAELSSRHPLTCHGLSLSLGGPEPLDEGFLERTRRFLERHRVPLYSEHLSYCSDDGQLYDLMPLPFTEEAVRHVAGRIARVQDVLGRRIAVENVSYYAAPWQAMDEADFVLAVLEEADCDLLLDVNNVYVNAVNHGYAARAFLARTPPARLASDHVAR